MNDESLELKNIREHHVTMLVNIKGHMYPTKVILNLGDIPFTSETDAHGVFTVEPNKGVCLIGDFKNDAKAVFQRHNDDQLFTGIIQNIEHISEIMGYKIQILNKRIEDMFIIMPHIYLNVDILK